jgi:predicted deacylase
VWRHIGLTEGRSLSAAHAAGIPSIYVEASGAGSIHGGEQDVMVGGIRHVMALLGMLDAAQPAPSPPRLLDGGAGDTDAALQCTHAGYCVLRAGAGEVVQAGMPIAEIVDEGAHLLEVIPAPYTGLVAMVRRRAQVSAGDGIVMLGPVPDAAD